MLISVGICTKNSFNSIKNCIDSIVVQKLPKNTYLELLIADSSKFKKKNRIDVNKLANKNLRVKHLTVDEMGIVFARNAIFKNAKGTALFSTDDDIIVNSNWLMTGIKALERFKKAGVIAGKVVLGNKIPEHFKKLLIDIGFGNNFWPYTLFSWTDKEFKFNKDSTDYYPSFANMIIRKKVYNGYKLDTQFANRHDTFKVFGGEDPDFFEDVVGKYDIVYYPKLVVKHIIREYKFNKRFFYWRYWEVGKERALFDAKYEKAIMYQLKDISLIVKLFKTKFEIKNQLHVIYFLSYSLTTIYLITFNFYNKRAYLYKNYFGTVNNKFIKFISFNIRKLLSTCAYYFPGLVDILIEILIAQINRKIIKNFPNSNTKIITVLQHRDIVAYLSMITSLRLATKKSFNFYAVNDGTLTPKDKQILSKYDSKVVGFNIPSKFIEWHWQTLKYYSLKKLFPNSNIVIIDSDVLFFKYPEMLLSPKSNVFMDDLKSFYSISDIESKYFFGFTPIKSLNAGVLAINTNNIDQKIFVKLFKILNKIEQSSEVNYHVAEQTAYALMFSKLSKKTRIQRLNENYLIFPKIKPEYSIVNTVCIHYTGYYNVERRVQTLSFVVKKLIEFY